MRGRPGEPVAGYVPIVESARRARDLVANYLWNEDDSGDEDDLHEAYEALRRVLGPSTPESVGATLRSESPCWTCGSLMPAIIEGRYCCDCVGDDHQAFLDTREARLAREAG